MITRRLQNRIAPRFSRGRKTGTGIAGRNMDGLGPTPPAVVSPLELAKDWHNIESVPIASNTSINDYGQVSILGATAPDQAIALTQRVQDAGGISFINRLVGNEDANNGSFSLAIRMQSAQDAICFNYRDSLLQIWERVAGAFKLLYDGPPKQLIVGKTVRLTALGTRVRLIIDGAEVTRVETAIITPGRIGIIARTWGATPYIIGDNYRVIGK